MKKILAYLLSALLLVSGLTFFAQAEGIITQLATPAKRISGVVEGVFAFPVATASATDVDGITVTPVWVGVNFSFGDSVSAQALLEYTATYTAPDGYTFADALAAGENQSLSSDKTVLTYTFYTYVIPKSAIYIDDAGSDDTADYAEGNYEKPYKTIQKAITALGGSGVIVIKDTVTSTATLIGAGAGKDIVIMGWDDESCLSMATSMNFNAPTTIRDLWIHVNTTNYTGMYARGNKFVIGDEHYTDMKITKDSGLTIQLMATGDGGTFPSADVTINSGTFDNVYLSGYGGTKVNGDVHWTINGGKINKFWGGLHGGNSSATHTVNGDTYITVNGGTFSTALYLTNANARGVTNGNVIAEINGGSFKTVSGCANIGSAFDGDMTLTVNGGTFSGGANSIVLNNCTPTADSTFTINYTGYTGDKAVLDAAINKTKVTQVIGPIYYVDAVNGLAANDGLTPETALNTMTNAFGKFTATVGGKIYVCGDYPTNISGGWTDIVGRAPVTISSYNGGKLQYLASVDMKSASTFENINIEIAKAYLSFRAANCPLIMGEGVNVTYAVSGSLQPTGTAYAAPSDEINMTFESGEYGMLFGGELGGSKVIGDINYTINGGSFTKGDIYLGSYASEPKSVINDGSVGGDINLTVNGGTISKQIFTANGYAPIAGDMNVIINGGTISSTVNLGAQKNTSISKTFSEVEYTYNPGVEGNIYVEVNGGNITGSILTKNRIEGKRVFVANNGLVPPVTKSTFDYTVFSSSSGTVKGIFNEDGTVSFSIIPKSSALPILVDGVEITKNASNIYTLSEGNHTITYDKSQDLAATLLLAPPRYGMKPATALTLPGGASTYNSIGNCTASAITWAPNDVTFKYDTAYKATVTLTSVAQGLTFNSETLANGININSKNKGNTYVDFTASLDDDKTVATVEINFAPIPTPTAANTTQSVKGIFKTERTGTASANFKPTVVTLVNKADSSISFTPVVTENATGGSYSIPTVPMGKYTLTIEKGGYLPYVYDNLDIYAGRNIELDADLLIAGDIDGTGNVDIDDLIIYLRSFVSDATAQVKTAADIFEDGIPGVAGLAYVKANLGNTTESASFCDEESKTMSLANTYYKLTVDKRLTVGYLGGSITANSGNKFIGFDEAFTGWISSAFPDAEVDYRQAGIGNTGSNFGIFRLDSQLMSNGERVPDLVFLEYACNDFATFGQEHIEMLMESLVLNVYKINPKADIVILLTAMSGYDAPRNAHIKVAEHYNIPIIDVGRQLGALNSAVGDCKVSTNDNLHPNTAGYELYTQIMKERIAPYLIGDKRPETATYTTRTLPTAIKDNLILDPQFIDPSSADVTKTGAWTTEAWSVTGSLTGKCVSSVTKGDTMSFSFNGSSFGFVFYKNSDMGIMEYRVDGGTWKMFNPGYSQNTYKHAQTFYVEDNLEVGSHTVDIRVTGYTSTGVSTAFPTSSSTLTENTNCKVGILAILYNGTN